MPKKKPQTEDERRQTIVDDTVDEYVRNKFQNVCLGRKVIITPVDVNKLTRQIMEKIDEKE